MKVFVTGTRGFPRIMGGVETHCQELYTRIADAGIDVTVARRTPYIDSSNSGPTLGRVRFVDIATPRSKHLEAIIHTFRAVFRARRAGADILHIHNIGPGLVTPLARLLGLKVVLTVHSFNYDHDKWNAAAKAVLRLAEWVSTRWANRVISISQPIKESLERRYPRLKVDLIFNGVATPWHIIGHQWLDRHGIGRRPYILGVGRLAPEKGFHDLLEAWRRAGIADRMDLVIAGDADHPTPYSTRLKNDARAAGAIMPGLVRGQQLAELYTNAALFVIPSYHEGLPIALLEAASYGLDALASDIEPNRIGLLDDDAFFPAGNPDAMAEKLRRKAAAEPVRRQYDLSAFNWDNIARDTIEIYRRLASE